MQVGVCLVGVVTTTFGGTTWTGGGGTSASWMTAANWGGALPLFDGTETLTFASGLTSGTTLTLDGSKNVGALSFTTSSGFSIAAGTGGTLNLYSGNITDSANGSVGARLISAGITLGDPSAIRAYTGTWNLSMKSDVTVSGNIGEAGGSRGLTVTGGGTLTLSGTNSFSGGLTISSGTVNVTSNSNLGGASGGLTLGGGTLQVNDNVTGSRGIAFNSSLGGIYVATGKTFEQSGAISGNGTLTTSYLGTVILSGSGSNGTGSTTVSGVLSLRGTVALGSGNLTLSYGMLELGNSNFTRSLGTLAGQVNLGTTYGGGFAAYGADRIVNLGGAGAAVTWGSGSFIVSGQSLNLGSPTATHTLDFQNPINLNGLTGSIALTSGINTAADAKLSGVISGSLAGSNFVINGPTSIGGSPGTLLLSNGNNSYIGTTTINAGTLLAGANATGTTGNRVLGNATSDVLVGATTGSNPAGLLTNGAFTISRNIRAQSGSTGTLSIGGNTADSSTFSGSIFLGTSAATGNSTGRGVTLTAAPGGTATFSGVIQNPTSVVFPGLLTKSGAGTVVLSGVNTYTGGTAISGGTLSISQVANLGASGALSINAGTLEVTNSFSSSRALSVNDAASTVQVDGSNILTVTSAISGSGTLNKSGSGTMQLIGANTFSGGSVVAAGTLQTTANNRLANTGALTTSGGTFDLQTFTETVSAVTLSDGAITGSGTGTLTGSSYTVQNGSVTAILAGSAALTKSTAGTVSLSGVNTYTGTTTINGGTLQINSTASMGVTSNGATINAGTLELLSGYNVSTTRLFSLGDVTSTFQVDANSTYTLNGAIGNAASAGSLTKTGSGTLVLGSANTYGGSGSTTAINAGTLQASSDNQLGNSATALSFGGSGTGVFQVNGASFSSARNVVLNSTGTVNTNNNNAAFSGAFSGNAGLTKTGEGTLTLSGTNTYKGDTTINAGTIVINSAASLGNGGALAINSATLEVAASFSTARNISLGNAASTIQVDPAQTYSVSGVVSGAGTLTKNGTGNLTLAGANTFTGETVVNYGTLTAAAASGNALANTTAITVNNSGTLLLGASNQINPVAPMTLNGGTFAKGNFSEGSAAAAGVGALTLAGPNSHLDFGTGTVGTLSFASFSNLHAGTDQLIIDGWTGTAYSAGNAGTDRLIFATDQTANLGSFRFTGYLPGAAEFQIGTSGYYEVVPTAVPEPGTYAAGFLAFAAVGGWSWRKSARARCAARGGSGRE